jgi:hypothetical protein
MKNFNLAAVCESIMIGLAILVIILDSWSKL